MITHLNVNYDLPNEQDTARALLRGINQFYIKIMANFSSFCEFFNLDPTDPTSQEKFAQLEQMVRSINSFSLEELTQMIKEGWKLQVEI